MIKIHSYFHKPSGPLETTCGAQVAKSFFFFSPYLDFSSFYKEHVSRTFNLRFSILSDRKQKNIEKAIVFNIETLIFSQNESCNLVNTCTHFSYCKHMFTWPTHGMINATVKQQ